ncbi:MAG: PCYCGC motif-containing (lipo)protein [Chloroflexota bacterium]|nr:PCYCGC motif-containing (lipo)protein [Chloroflexota bacterium]
MKRLSRSMIALVALGLLLAAAGAACQSGSAEKQPDDGRPQTRSFPDFVYTSDKSYMGYALALENKALFQKMPCYCGCANLAVPHENLYQCFVNPDGTYDEHAAYCTICADIAVDAVQWQREGASIAEVQTKVDSKYADSGPRTNTPPVQE